MLVKVASRLDSDVDSEKFATGCAASATNDQLSKTIPLSPNVQVAEHLVITVLSKTIPLSPNVPPPVLNNK